MNNSIELAFLRDQKAQIQDTVIMSLEDLYTNYLNQPTIGKKNGAAWMPVSIEAGPRNAERIQTINLLVLDVEAHAVPSKDNSGKAQLDHNHDQIKEVTGTTPPAFRTIMSELQTRKINCAGHTTYSHHGSFLPADRPQERYRLIFSLSRSLEKSELKTLGKWVASILGLYDCFDIKALEPARLYYLPRCPKDRHECFEHAYLEGAPLDVDQLLLEYQLSLQPHGLERNEQYSEHYLENKDIFKAFNACFSINEILLKHGYRPAAGDRWIAPQSTSGQAGVRIIPNTDPIRVYSSHSNDPLNDHKSHDSYDCMRILEHQGDQKAAYQYALEALESQNVKVIDNQPVENSINRPPEELFTPMKSLPYPIDALPDSIKNPVLEVQSFVKAPLAMVACSALAAINLVVHPLFDIRRDKGLEGPSSLFFLTFAASGERKSTCDGFFTRPIELFEQEQHKLKEPQIQKYTAEYDAWISEKAGIQLAIKNLNSKKRDSTHKEVSTTELEVLKQKLIHLESQKPIKPKVPRMIYMDVTPEALSCELHDNWPAGGLVSSEAGMIFGSHSMGSESVMRNLALYNKLWDGTPIRIDRKASESYLLANSRFSISLQIQEAAFMEFLHRAGELARGIGFLARFLVSYPESTQGTRFYTPPPLNWPYLEAFHQKLKDLLLLQADSLIDGQLKPQMLELSPEAKKLWIEFHDEVETKLCIGGELQDVRDVASKIADNAVRLACVLQAISNQHIRHIDSESMQSAIKITEWHLNESFRFFSMIALPEDIANAQKLEHWIISYCKKNNVDSIPYNYLLKYGPSKLRKKSILEVPYKLLCEANRVWTINGLSPKRTQVHPDLLK